MTHLDTRKERPLTSREIAKIIGGIIGGSIGAGASPDDLLVMFRSAQAFLQGHSEVGPGPESTLVVAGAIGGLVGALLQWCRVGDVCTAVEWICEHWTDLVTAVTEEDARSGPRVQA